MKMRTSTRARGISTPKVGGTQPCSELRLSFTRAAMSEIRGRNKASTRNHSGSCSGCTPSVWAWHDIYAIRNLASGRDCLPSWESDKLPLCDMRWSGTSAVRNCHPRRLGLVPTADTFTSLPNCCDWMVRTCNAKDVGSRFRRSPMPLRTERRFVVLLPAPSSPFVRNWS